VIREKIQEETSNAIIKREREREERRALNNNTRSFEPFLQKVLVAEENWQWKKKRGRFSHIGIKKEKILAM